ncbi:hypothetical protein BDW62DRAFT_200030 [Aspergillus aurantiobrunneus]
MAASSKDQILPPPARPLVRVTFYFSKIPSMTHDEFYDYWRNTHGVLTVAAKSFEDAKVQQYTQIRHDHSLSQEAAKLGFTLLDLEWDGCSDLYFQTWDDFHRFATSDELRNVLGRDGAKMTCQEKGVKVVVGLVDPVFQRGP